MPDEASPGALPSLRELLRRPVFADAELLAGRGGLDGPVRWVHVGEIPDIASYLSGQELVLSTGVGLRSPRERRRYLELLAACGVAGVCIELGRYLRRVPEDMLTLADRLTLPLVAFRRPVRFVDITQDVHRLILGGEARPRRLADLQSDLARLGAAPHAEDVLAVLGSWLQGPVLLLEPLGDLRWGRALPKSSDLEAEARARLAALLEGSGDVPDRRLPDGTRMASRVLPGADGLGLLAAACLDEEVFATGVALDLAAGVLRARGEIVGQGDAGAGVSLLRDLLAGAAPAEGEFLRRLREAGGAQALPRRTSLWLLLGVDLAQAAAIGAQAAQWLRDRGQAALGGSAGRLSVLLLLDPAPGAARPLAEGLLQSLAERHGAGLRLGAAQPCALKDLAAAGGEAALALAAAAEPGVSLAADLGPLRALVHVRGDFDLQASVEDALGPVLAYDRRRGTELLATLEAVLRVGRRADAARLLQIRRQTLYYRMERLRSLLGADAFAEHRRLGLRLALIARRMLELRQDL